jgi:hypothetical protein
MLIDQRHLEVRIGFRTEVLDLDWTIARDDLVFQSP